MAKKKKDRLTVTTATHVSNTMQLPVKGGDGLPEYQRYYTSKEFRFFFEPPECESEILKGLKNTCSTPFSFKIVSDGKNLVGLEIAKTFSRLITQYFINKKSIKPADFNSHTKHFFIYLASLEKTPTVFEEITFKMVVEFLVNRPSKSQGLLAKHFFLTLMPLHPHSRLFNIGSISVSRQLMPPIQGLDMDSLLDEKDYSDHVMMQMLAYCFYELDVWKKRWELMQNTTKENLGEYYFGKYSIHDPILAKTLNSGGDGHNKLFLNLLLEAKEERAGRILSPDKKQSVRLHKVTNHTKYKSVYGNTVYPEYTKYLVNKMWSFYAKSEQPEYRAYLHFKTQHLPAILVLYLMISTGKNQETIVSIKRNYGNRAWYESFDFNLGVDEKTPNSQQVIRVVGQKTKGVSGVKSIPIRIPINSPVFEYMKLYDDIANDPNREHFFNFNSSTLRQAYNKFCTSFKILDDDNKLVTSIQTTRLRKTFAGHLLMKLVEDVDNAQDLVSKLREALNHQEFDTTLFSYIMKTGLGNQVINAAIVALTTNMLEKAMIFQGAICEDTDRDPTNKEAYLCDCTDDTKPTHNIPIANRCKKYDMCLGCERSEVYASHVPNICYRVMQYDEIARQNPLTFSGLLEDRRQIALDTIKKFSHEHGRGVQIVEHGYFEAAKAMKNGTPLLPAIMQFQ
ncbi:hypothetical protein [uncultured Paraglaciecola sp.]|uniref:hypothetical protein n=1 Tax=uncultured Paraglaciecola sp. TaxID=1765024 RepID=UPI0030DB43B0|tara:strand:- start:1396 stop:3429 length:2034 start_codon:yes stop_codon:yes gene_type:complete